MMEGKYDIIRDMGGFEPLLDNRTPIDRRAAVPSEALRPGAEKMELRLEEHLRLPLVRPTSFPPSSLPPSCPVHYPVRPLLSHPHRMPHNCLFHRQEILVQKLNFVLDASAIADELRRWQDDPLYACTELS